MKVTCRGVEVGGAEKPCGTVGVAPFVAMPGAPSSFLLLVVRPGAPLSVLE